MKKTILILISVMVLLSFSVNAAIVNHFIMNDVSGTTMTAEVGSDGTVSSASIWNVNGKLNGAIYPNALYYGFFTPAVASDWTISVWFKIDSIGGGDIFRKDSGSRTPRIFIQSTTTILINGDGDKTFTVPTMSFGTWYHLIVTSDGGSGNIRLYLDNTESSTGVLTGTVNVENGQYNIGANDGGGAKFAGFLDDFRLYDGVISSEVRVFLFNSGSGTEDSNPPPPDSTPPVLSDIVCTSPNPDKNVNSTYGCLTTDSTPTFDITCSDNVACTGVKIGTENLSFTNMPTSCTGGPTSYTCTLGSTSRETHNVFFQASDAASNLVYSSTYVHIGDCAYNSDCTSTQQCLFNYTCVTIPTFSCLNVRPGCSLSYNPTTTCAIVSQ